MWIVPSGIEIGVIRFTFQTPVAVSSNPSDQVEFAVPML